VGGLFLIYNEGYAYMNISAKSTEKNKGKIDRIVLGEKWDCPQQPKGCPRFVGLLAPKTGTTVAMSQMLLLHLRILDS
jgi:hypothetical protein